MKPCPHCNAPVQFWQLWSARKWSPYTCPTCRNLSEVTLLSRAIGVLTVFPLVGLGVYLLFRLDIQSTVLRLLVILPMAFGGSLLIGFLLASFGTFKPMHTYSRRQIETQP